MGSGEAEGRGKAQWRPVRAGVLASPLGLERRKTILTFVLVCKYIYDPLQMID